MNCVNNGNMAAAMAAALGANSTMSSDKTEMRHYLDRLKAMVPQCPKNRKVSRQELIEHVIEYISDLQDTLQSDSEDEDSPPPSPAGQFSFSDAFNQQAQYGSFNQQPQYGNYSQQPQFGGYGQQPQFSNYGQQPNAFNYGEASKMQASAPSGYNYGHVQQGHSSSDMYQGASGFGSSFSGSNNYSYGGYGMGASGNEMDF